MNNALLLPNWSVGEPTIIDDVLHVPAKYDLLPDSCPKCGVVDRLYKHGAKDFTFRDAPVHGRQAVVDVTRQRYRCRECNETFWQPIPDIDDSRRMMRRCKEYIEDNALSRPNTHVAADIGVDEKIVRQIGGDYARRLDAYHVATMTAPRVLGIDELKLAGSMRAIFTDIETGRPIEILHTHHQTYVMRFLRLLPNNTNIEVVTMDMWAGYRNAVRKELPQAAVVVDKWHVQRLVIDGMETARRKFQREVPKETRIKLRRSRKMFLARSFTLSSAQMQDLDDWLRSSPDLAGAYEKKEAFMRIWSLTDRMEVLDALKEWRASIAQDAPSKLLFQKAVTAINNWQPEILNYFDHGRFTNAATEARNGVIKKINRAGSGYSWEQIRARALFGKQTVRAVVWLTVRVRFHTRTPSVMASRSIH